MRKLILPVILLLFTCTSLVRAQYDAQFSMYHMAMGYYNPAVTGNTDRLNVFATHRQQWIGIDGAPKTFLVMADMPFRIGETNHGVGIVAFTEKIGLFNLTHVAAQYAYKQKLFGGTLSVGIQAGIANQVFEGDKVYIPTGSEIHFDIDGAIPRTEVDAMTVDINAGLYYTHKKFYLGLGAMHLMEPEYELDENASTYIPLGLNLTGGYNIQTQNPLIELQPSFFMKTDMVSFQADFTARMVYNKMFNGGLSWRVNESFIVLLGATFGKFQVGYAYDFPYNALLRASSGSHELMIKFSMQLNKMKTGKNKHKSVRIL